MSDRIVDACCLINLYGSKRPYDILEALGGLHLTPQVRRESLGIRTNDPDNPQQMRHEAIDLEQAIKRKLLSVCEISNSEFESMVRYARELDDGEASSLAVAQSRGWRLATDDKKARRIAAANGVQVLSTSELIQQWAIKTKASDNDIAIVLSAIQRHARFLPSAKDPLVKWWRDLIS